MLQAEFDEKARAEEELEKLEREQEKGSESRRDACLVCT